MPVLYVSVSLLVHRNNSCRVSKSRRYLHGKYKYAVTYKGADEESKLLPRDHKDFEGCKKLIAEFDDKHPLGSLPFDKPEDQRKWHASTRQYRGLRSTRRRS